jgi:hypothetical protein
MFKKLVAFIGLVLFLFAIVTSKVLKKGEEKALALDDQKTSYAVVQGDLLPCTWNVKPPEKVMSENSTQSVVVEATSSKDEECESFLSLRAPGFDISPSREEQTINLAKDSKGSISWILSPRKTGTFDASVSDMIDTKIFGVTVTNIFGLSTVQAKSASFLGTIFGPMLTVPWWWDRFKPKKKNPEVIKGPEDKTEV